MPGLEHIGDKPCLVIGRAGMDLYADPPGTHIEAATQFTATLGGSSANIAVALARAGAKVALMTCVSDDAVGRFCLKQLDAYGIERTHVRTVDGEVRNSLAIVETRLENCQSVIYRNGAADFAMTTGDAMAVDFSRYSALITTGTVFAAEPSRSAAFQAFDLARQAGLSLIFDVDYRPYSWVTAEEASEVYSRAARLCDVIVGNDVEFGFMAGNPERGLDRARSLVTEGARVVIYKMGEHGAITITAGGEMKTGIFKTSALKPTGAGDAFLGNLVASLARRLPLKDAVLRGSAAAAIVVSKVGCAPAMPTAEELDTFISAHDCTPPA